MQRLERTRKSLGEVVVRVWGLMGNYQASSRLPSKEVRNRVRPNGIAQQGSGISGIFIPSSQERTDIKQNGAHKVSIIHSVLSREGVV